jgi:hypothetical protein
LKSFLRPKAPLMAVKKLGHPVPESNFQSDRNSGRSQPRQEKIPLRCSLFSERGGRQAFTPVGFGQLANWRRGERAFGVGGEGGWAGGEDAKGDSAQQQGAAIGTEGLHGHALSTNIRADWLRRIAHKVAICAESASAPLIEGVRLSLVIARTVGQPNQAEASLFIEAAGANILLEGP